MSSSQIRSLKDPLNPNTPESSSTQQGSASPRISGAAFGLFGPKKDFHLRVSIDIERFLAWKYWFNVADTVLLSVATAAFTTIDISYPISTLIFLLCAIMCLGMRGEMFGNFDLGDVKARWDATRFEDEDEEIVPLNDVSAAAASLSITSTTSTVTSTRRTTTRPSILSCISVCMLAKRRLFNAGIYCVILGLLAVGVFLKEHNQTTTDFESTYYIPQLGRVEQTGEIENDGPIANYLVYLSLMVLASEALNICLDASLKCLRIFDISEKSIAAKTDDKPLPNYTMLENLILTKHKAWTEWADEDDRVSYDIFKRWTKKWNLVLRTLGYWKDLDLSPSLVEFVCCIIEPIDDELGEAFRNSLKEEGIRVSRASKSRHTPTTNIRTKGWQLMAVILLGFVNYCAQQLL
eukprot:TRINITY_DN18727_c0_g1::TRINITY_DN18727_c0_g1_i1::g.20407::m.20407 TRINITY_DN18727_c0_g1::TRINITY_DN18727_c0_g1_i1::g.20407  ORF type:complete len:415 (+),score=77.44,DUF4653/PF15546.1/0.12 TRINITY_DN18727_c0_g1_i1:25-1245(+)